MAGIDEVLERLVADGDFRAALARDPAAALADYHLTRDEIELLASRLDDSDDAERTVEQRTSKSAMFALLTSLAGPGGGGTADPGHDDQMEVLSWSWGETQGDDTTLGDPAVPDDAVDADGDYHKAEMDLQSWSWGEEGGDAAPDDLAVPDDAADELYNKSQGKVEYSWKIEEGVKAEVDPDALTHKVEPGDTVPGAPSTDDEGIIVINGLEDDGTAEPTESVGLDFNKVDFNKVDFNEMDVGPEPLDPALSDVGDEPEEAVNVYLKLGDAKGEAQEPASSQPQPDSGMVGVNPPDDGIVGLNPPDDSIVGSLSTDGSPAVRTDAAAAMDVDDVMEIEDV